MNFPVIGEVSSELCGSHVVENVSNDIDCASYLQPLGAWGSSDYAPKLVLATRVTSEISRFMPSLGPM